MATTVALEFAAFKTILAKVFDAYVPAAVAASLRNSPARSEAERGVGRQNKSEPRQRRHCFIALHLMGPAVTPLPWLKHRLLKLRVADKGQTLPPPARRLYMVVEAERLTTMKSVLWQKFLYLLYSEGNQ